MAITADTVTDADHLAFDRVRAHTDVLLTRAWARAAFTSDAEDALVAELARITQAGRRQTFTLTRATARRMLAVLGYDTHIGRDVLSALDDRLLRSGIIAVRKALADGLTFEEARQRGLSRLLSNVNTEATVTRLDAAHDAYRASGVRRIERVLEPNACEYCKRTEGFTSTLQRLRPLHPGCRCTVRPVPADT